MLGQHHVGGSCRNLVWLTAEPKGGGQWARWPSCRPRGAGEGVGGQDRTRPAFRGITGLRSGAQVGGQAGVSGQQGHRQDSTATYASREGSTCFVGNLGRACAALGGGRLGERGEGQFHGAGRGNGVSHSPVTGHGPLVPPEHFMPPNSGVMFLSTDPVPATWPHRSPTVPVMPAHHEDMERHWTRPGMWKGSWSLS